MKTKSQAISNLISGSLWDGLSFDDEKSLEEYSNIVVDLQLATQEEAQRIANEDLCAVIKSMSNPQKMGSHKDRLKEILTIVFDLPNQKEKWQGRMQKAFDEAKSNRNYLIAEFFLEWDLAEGDVWELKRQAGLEIWNTVFSPNLIVNPHHQEWMRRNPEFADLVYQSDEALNGYISLCYIDMKISAYDPPFQLQQRSNEQIVYDVVSEHLMFSKLLLEHAPSHEFPLLLWCKMCTIHGEKFLSPIDRNHLLMLDQLGELKKEIRERRYPGVNDEKFSTLFLNDLHQLWLARLPQMERLAGVQHSVAPYLFGGVIMKGMAGLCGTASRMNRFETREKDKETDQKVVDAIYALADKVVEKSFRSSTVNDSTTMALVKDAGVFMHQVLESPSLLLPRGDKKIVLKSNLSAALLLTRRGEWNEKILDALEQFPIQEHGLIHDFLNATNKELIMSWLEKHSAYKKQELIKNVKKVEMSDKKSTPILSRF